MKIIFMGTPDFAVPTLLEIMGRDFDVVAVFTQPPRPAGRKMAERKTPVHETADLLGLTVHHPISLRDSVQQDLIRSLDADIGVVVAYGLILPEQVLAASRGGFLNVHASLLPRWRGAAPIHRAVMAGDRKSGVMIMQMEKGLDTGPIAMVEEVEITPNMTTGELHDSLKIIGADLAVRALTAFTQGGLVARPQPDLGATYAKKIEKSETRINWLQDERDVHNHIRGLSPWPGAWFEFERRGKLDRVKVLKSQLAEGSGAPGTVLDDDLTIACGNGAVRLSIVQRAGGAPMPASEFMRGAGASLRLQGDGTSVLR